MVVHANHVNEIDAAVEAAVDSIRRNSLNGWIAMEMVVSTPVKLTNVGLDFLRLDSVWISANQLKSKRFRDDSKKVAAVVIAVETQAESTESAESAIGLVVNRLLGLVSGAK